MKSQENVNIRMLVLEMLLTVSDKSQQDASQPAYSHIVVRDVLNKYNYLSHHITAPLLSYRQIEPYSSRVFCATQSDQGMDFPLRLLPRHLSSGVPDAGGGSSVRRSTVCRRGRPHEAQGDLLQDYPGGFPGKALRILAGTVQRV